MTPTPKPEDQRCDVVVIEAATGVVASVPARGVSLDGANRFVIANRLPGSRDRRIVPHGKYKVGDVYEREA